MPQYELPPPVTPGDRVGVAALSSAVDPLRLHAGLEALRELGFEVVLARNLSSRWGPFAGNDRERLEAFHRLAADRTVRAIFFARGGHGALRLLPAIDWKQLRRRPRAYIGYSDLTPFLLGVVRRLGLVAFHGPMIAADLARGLSSPERDSLLGALAGKYPCSLALGGWLRRGEARGVVLGGCLSLLVTSLATPFSLDLAGALLFLEDVSEPLYRLDRMLTHLLLSGNLDAISGLLLGHLGIEGEGDLRAEWFSETLLKVNGPVAYGAQCGHGPVNYTLPLGLVASLDPAGDRFWLGCQEQEES